MMAVTIRIIAKMPKTAFSVEENCLIYPRMVEPCLIRNSFGGFWSVTIGKTIIVRPPDGKGSISAVEAQALDEVNKR